MLVYCDVPSGIDRSQLMKQIAGVIFVVAFVALLALLVIKKENRNNIKPGTEIVSTNLTLTVDNINPTFPTDEQ